METLAHLLGISIGELSKRTSGGKWKDKEINQLLEYTGLEIVSVDDFTRRIETLKDAMRIILSTNGKEHPEAKCKL